MFGRRSEPSVLDEHVGMKCIGRECEAHIVWSAPAGARTLLDFDEARFRPGLRAGLVPVRLRRAKGNVSVKARMPDANATTAVTRPKADRLRRGSKRLAR